MAYNGQLNSNEIFGSLFNMIIAQQVFVDNFKHNYNLVDKAREEAGLYGDTKVFYSADILKSHVWGADSEASNLLALARPSAVNSQAITINQFRQVDLTIDYYLSKRAWLGEGVFAQFNGLFLDMLSETKKVYENTYYNVYIGNLVATGASQNITWSFTLPTGVVEGTEEANRLVAAFIATNLADLIDNGLKDYSRSYNDNGYLRSYAEEDLKFVWNASFVNQMLKRDLPTIFHNDILKTHLFEDKLPSRYFGTGVSTSTTATLEGERAANEYAITDGGGVTTDYFAGDVLPTGSFSGVSHDSYVNDATVLCKIFVKLPPFMSAFTTGTSFFNAKSLTENHYLTWGFNKPTALTNYPLITIKLSVSEATVDDGGGEE